MTTCEFCGSGEIIYVTDSYEYHGATVYRRYEDGCDDPDCPEHFPDCPACESGHLKPDPTVHDGMTCDCCQRTFNWIEKGEPLTAGLDYLTRDEMLPLLEAKSNERFAHFSQYTIGPVKALKYLVDNNRFFAKGLAHLLQGPHEDGR